MSARSGGIPGNFFKRSSRFRDEISAKISSKFCDEIDIPAAFSFPRIFAKIAEVPPEITAGEFAKNLSKSRVPARTRIARRSAAQRSRGKISSAFSKNSFVKRTAPSGKLSTKISAFPRRFFCSETAINSKLPPPKSKMLGGVPARAISA